MPWVLLIVLVGANPIVSVGGLVLLLVVGGIARGRMATDLKSVRQQEQSLPVAERRRKHRALLAGGLSFCAAAVGAFCAPLVGVASADRAEMSLTMSVLLLACGAYFVWSALKKLRVA